MKRFFVCAVLFAAMFLTVSCGGGSSDDNNIDEAITTPYYDSTSGLIWSAKSSFTMKWQEALDYCSNYSEDGLSGWHLPTISELRTLIENCPDTQIPSTSYVPCEVKDNCLSSDCYYANVCNGCGQNSEISYSKLGDRELFWSSSVVSDSELSDYAWYVYFADGGVRTTNRNGLHTFVRCVRY